MTKYYLLAIITGCLFLLSAALKNEKKEQPRETVRKRLQARMDNLSEAVQALQHAVKTGDESVRSKYLLLRKAFKQWEYLGEQLDPVFVKDYINGSPLPKLERNSFGLHILKPKGMQVLDELIYSDDPENAADDIISELSELAISLSQADAPAFLYDRNIFEGARLELIRLYNLGLTGFDTPGSGNSIPDAITALTTLQEDLSLYDEVIAAKDKLLAQRIRNNFRDGILYLKQHNDFEKLDRLYVLTQYINPLYADLLTAHTMLEIETTNEITAFPPPYNYKSKNLFANDFLDPFRYLNLPEQIYSPELVGLGRTLFFDPVLSATNERSCASCHQPSKAFTDGAAKSMAMGMKGTVSRNAPTLINSVYAERYFHDLRAEALEDQIEHVMVSDKEFNTQIFDIVSKLEQSRDYRQMFQLLFPMIPGQKITKQTVSFAIAAYVSSLRGFNAPFDKYVRGEQPHLDQAAKRGYNLFMGKAACGTCHFAPVFNGTVPPLYLETESEVLGVAENPYSETQVVDPDEGRAIARLKEQAPFYRYSFKTPTVRNAALTAPYMHNGAYKTLDDVMDFYNKGGGKGFGIVLEHQTLPFDNLDLDKKEIADIIAFMNSLTDTAGMTALPSELPKFSARPEWNKRTPGGLY